MLTEQRACDLILSQLSQRRSYGWEMSQLSKDPAIKLFGRTIPLHEVQPNPTEPELSSEPEKVSCKQTKDARTNSSNSDKPDISEDADPTSPITSTSNNQNEHVKEEVSETTNNAAPNLTESKSQEVKPDLEKALKKPDKIIPCPRCNSMDTKFCYYNNYNVNQPRHFCKNCQRYWTAGGTMRNVPVGAGRRKNKHPSSHYRHIMMSSEALMHQQGIPLVGSTTMIGTDASIGTGVGTVLKFGSEVPLCESTAKVFNIEEERKSADLVMDEQPCASSIGVENKLHACAATGEKNAANGFNDGSSVPPMPCYPGPALMYPWGPVPFPFVPASFWGWPSGPGPWNMPWTAFTNGMVLPSSPISNSSSSVNGSATLGKHSREPATQSDEKLEMMEKKNLWAPKTLRIVDPDEAAKSSIWATLGIKPDDGSIFKSFGAKERGTCQVTDSGPVLHANPAALSRSRSFQERT